MTAPRNGTWPMPFEGARVTTSRATKGHCTEVRSSYDNVAGGPLDVRGRAAGSDVPHALWGRTGDECSPVGGINCDGRRGRRPPELAYFRGSGLRRMLGL